MLSGFEVHPRWVPLCFDENNNKHALAWKTV